MASPTHDIQPAPGRVARLAALEGRSSDEKSRTHHPDVVNRQGYEGGDASGSDPYGDTPESGAGASQPVTSRRQGSLSSNSVFGALGEDSSPSNQHSSPDGMQSGQSEQLPHFKDYYSDGDIHPGDKVATLWAYQPRAGDEFELQRGDMVKIVGIWDDGWATGVRINDRAEDYDGKHKILRDSGVSNGSLGRDTPSPLPEGEVKAFPVSRHLSKYLRRHFSRWLILVSSCVSVCRNIGGRLSKVTALPTPHPPVVSRRLAFGAFDHRAQNIVTT